MQWEVQTSGGRKLDHAREGRRTSSPLGRQNRLLLAFLFFFLFCFCCFFCPGRRFVGSSVVQHELIIASLSGRLVQRSRYTPSASMCARISDRCLIFPLSLSLYTSPPISSSLSLQCCRSHLTHRELKAKRLAKPLPSPLHPPCFSSSLSSSLVSLSTFLISLSLSLSLLSPHHNSQTGEFHSRKSVWAGIVYECFEKNLTLRVNWPRIFLALTR